MQSMGGRYGDNDGDGQLSAEELDAINAYADADQIYDGDPLAMKGMMRQDTGPALVDNTEDDVTRGKSAAQLVLSMTEKTMPGDIGHLANVGMGEGQSIWDRMCMLINARSLDLRILMDAHDRRNRGFVSVATFRRSLCYAFGNQWIELGMSSKEFNEITGPYLSRRPNNPGDPEVRLSLLQMRDGPPATPSSLLATQSFSGPLPSRSPLTVHLFRLQAYIMWQKFTSDVQTLADKRFRTEGFLQRCAAG